jgi:hypothetical protein
MNNFMDEFLVTRSQFLPAHECLRLLLQRLDITLPRHMDGREAEQWATNQAALRSRVMQVLKRWYRHSFPELKNDVQFMETLAQWLSNADMQSADETFFFHATMLGAISTQVCRPRARTPTAPNH